MNVLQAGSFLRRIGSHEILMIPEGGKWVIAPKNRTQTGIEQIESSDDDEGGLRH